MKTIMIRDDVYELLYKIKGNKSFSEIILELIKESKQARKKRILKLFGSMNKEEAEELEKIVNELRKSFHLR